jgi:hypothetical protein
MTNFSITPVFKEADFIFPEGETPEHIEDTPTFNGLFRVFGIDPTGYFAYSLASNVPTRDAAIRLAGARIERLNTPTTWVERMNDFSQHSVVVESADGEKHVVYDPSLLERAVITSE